MLHSPLLTLRRVRRLEFNKLGPEGGMALAEALKSNNTLEHLGSAAPHRTHTRPCTASCFRVFHPLPRFLDVPLNNTPHPARTLIATSHFPTRALD